MGTRQLEREIKLRFAQRRRRRGRQCRGRGDAGCAAGGCRRTACWTPPTSACARALGAAGPDGQGRSLLTYKGPVQPSPWKLREERETMVSDGETMLLHSRAAGLHRLVPLPEVPGGIRLARRDHRARRNAHRHVRRDRGQRDGHHRDRRCPRPHRARLHRRFLPGAVRAALRGPRPGAGTCCSRNRKTGIVPCSPPCS